MTDTRYNGVDPLLYPNGAPAPSASATLSWAAVAAGTIGAIALSLVLLVLGSAFGLATVSPWPGVGAKPESFTIGAGIWLIVTEWLSAALGGYLAGRLRVRWHGVHGDEIFFRDTAHGFIVWATATVIVAVVAVVATALSSLPPVPADVPQTKEAVDAARKVAATFAAFTGLSMVVGAFVASIAGVIGGRLRDLHP